MRGRNHVSARRHNPSSNPPVRRSGAFVCANALELWVNLDQPPGQSEIVVPIHPLPQFEADLKEYEEQRDKEAYERLKAPTTIVVRYGVMKMIGEFPYDGDAKPGCGSKIVVRTFRGVEIGEMLTSTCPNAGCSKSVTRKEMLEYIENSGGRQYPFSAKGKAMRVATKEDMDRQAKLEQSKHALKTDARERAGRLVPKAKIVELEPILSQDRITAYYTSEEKIDVHALQRDLQAHHAVHVEMRQVGARDEARLTADYERCGQYCCCKNFLKVLKPVSMRSAKVQKATLDPLKISGRCGRLMCCLRYEDETYETLRKKLPKRKKLVGTPDGDGIVVDTQILTQLVLVELDGTRQRIAVPVEDLTEPTGRTGEDVAREKAQAERAQRQAEQADLPETEGAPKGRKRRRRRRKAGSPQGEQSQAPAQPQVKPQSSPVAPGDESSQRQAPDAKGETPSSGEGSETPAAARRKRRRRRRRRGPGGGSDSSGGGSSSGSGGSGTSDGPSE